MAKQLPPGAKLLFRLHTHMYRLSGGLIGHWLSPTARCLLLTTVGARSGQRRVSPLLYGRDGSRLILVASQGGLPKNPPWYHNLRAHPEVTVQVGRQRHRMTACEVTDQAERDRLWGIMAASYAGYDRYQRATTRRIPIILLKPRAAAGPSRESTLDEV